MAKKIDAERIAKWGDINIYPGTDFLVTSDYWNKSGLIPQYVKRFNRCLL